MYRVLFIHKDFPAQFGHVARSFAADPRCRVTAIAETHAAPVDGVRALSYAPQLAAADSYHPYLYHVGRAVMRGQTVAALCARLLMEEDYRPDLIIAHNGWGEMLYVKDIWPQAKLVGYFEYFYHGRGGDLDFDPEFPSTVDDCARVRTMNATNLLGLDAADLGISPTAWQRTRHPPVLQGKIVELHEGIDTQRARPAPAAAVTLADGTVLRPGPETITYVARELEPYRGFHMFMRALPEMLARRPQARAVIVGGTGVAYGRPVPEPDGWRGRMLAELGGRLDLRRVHFSAPIPHPAFVRLMRMSSAHVYLTYPFVLSWSMLEAMACGALVVGSDTAPVAEVIRHGENGLLAPFHDPSRLAATVAEALADPDRTAPLRRAARATVVGRYDAAGVCLPAWRALLAERCGAPPL